MSTKFTAILTPPNAPLRGRVMPPGSKSITNRALLLAALAIGTSRLTGALKSDDTRYMSQALRDMGVEITEPDDTTFVVTGSGVLQAPAKPLFLGNAGTATRFLTAAVASVDGTVVVDGDEHMRKRPIEPLVAALRSFGIDIASTNKCPPVTVRGHGRLPAGRIEVDGGLSSQYVSALLMMATLGAGPIEIALTTREIGARGYIDLTLAAMRAFGAQVAQKDGSSWVVEPTGYLAADYHIEPDASAATYLWAAEALTGGAIDIGTSAPMTQPDAKAKDVIAQFPHLPSVIDGEQMQDAVPTIAVLAAFNAAPVRFTGIANLRVKECDRIAALDEGLNRIKPGLSHQEGDDLIVDADPALIGTATTATIDPHADHRMAMSFALVGLKMSGLVIDDAGCVAKTYPDYWDALRSLGVAVATK